MVIIVYDIPNNKKRTKLAHFLEGYGDRVQFSVFECFITLEEMRQLAEKVKTKVDPTEDNVRFYWLSSEAQSLVITIGSETPSAPANYFIV
jgi:CRISPR-associated protein Cas2